MNVLELHWSIKLYRFIVHNSAIHHLHTAQYIHHPTSYTAYNDTCSQHKNHIYTGPYFSQNNVSLLTLDSSFIFEWFFHNYINFLCKKKWGIKRESNFSKIIEIGWLNFIFLTPKPINLKPISEVTWILIKNGGTLVNIANPIKKHIYIYI